MKSWTGLTGDADAVARETGRIFYCVERAGELISIADSTGITTGQFLRFLGDHGYDAWCSVIADNIAQAVERYDDAHDQWAEAEKVRFIQPGK